MTETFQQAVQRLVQKHHGVQAEAARAAELSTALISETLQGKGPTDPRGETWYKVYQALGEKPPAKVWMVRNGEERYETDRERRCVELAHRIMALPDGARQNILGLIESLGGPAAPVDD
jgi:hypothetical protein